MRGLLEAFPEGRNLVLLDNFEDHVDRETLEITDRTWTRRCARC